MNAPHQALSLSLLLALAGGTAAAQDAMPVAPEQQADSSIDPRAVEILEASQRAIAESGSLVFQVVKTMEKTEELAPENAMFASISIGAKGTIRAIKDDNGRWSYRIDGTADDIGKKDAFEIVVLREPTTASWLEQDSKTLIKANRNLARGRELSTETEFGVQYVFGTAFAPAFESLKRAPSLKVLEPEVIDGVLCDVVRVGYNESNESKDKILYIGTVDGLPRYVRDVLVTGFENRIRFTYQDAEQELTTESIAIEAPEGWGLAYRPESLRPGGATPRTETAIQAAADGEGPVGYEVGNRAPAFRGQTILGEDVTSDSMNGKTTVLVFWASWLPGSGDLVEFLGETRANQSDLGIITFAVRERSPDAAFNMLVDAGLDDVPMMINARDAVLAYGVTRAPLVLIVNDEGVIEYRSSGSNAAEIVAEVRALLGEGE